MERPSPGKLERGKSTSTPDWRRSWIVQLLAYAIAIGSSLAIWLGVCVATGVNEAWDSPVYFWFGVPAVTIVSAALGFVTVHRPWRWAPIMAASQFVLMVVMQGMGPLFLVGLVFMFVQALPWFAAAYVGSFLGRRMDRVR